MHIGLQFELAYYHNGKDGNVYVVISDNNNIDTTFLVGKNISILSATETDDTITLDTTNYKDSYYIKIILERTIGDWCNAMLYIYNIYGL